MSNNNSNITHLGVTQGTSLEFILSAVEGLYLFCQNSKKEAVTIPHAKKQLLC
jgi:hypothetical protein